MRILVLACCSVFCSIALFGQAGTGTITGTVTDPTGALIPNASIEVTSTETNALYPTVSTETGAYSVPRLPPGSYSVTVTAAGFKKLTRTGLTVDAGQTLPLDLTLQVGSASESVTVSAEGNVAQDRERRRRSQHHALAIGRSCRSSESAARTPAAWASAIRTTPSCCFLAPAIFRTSRMIVNGAPTNTAGYRVEGLDNTNHTVAQAIQENQPSADAVQEVAVQTSNYAAEFGQAGGGLINITMKSGTNQYHGTGYEFFVNEDLNAAIPSPLRPRAASFGRETAATISAALSAVPLSSPRSMTAGTRPSSFTPTSSMRNRRV